MESHWNRLIESMANKDIKRLQNERIRNQFHYLRENSLFYEQKWNDAGCSKVEPTVDDLSQYPFTTKEEIRRSLRDAPPLGYHQAAADKDLIRVHSSSGTTGEPTYFALTRADQAMWMESMSRTFWAAGMRPCDVYAHGLPVGMMVGGFPVQDAVENVGALFFSSAPGGTTRLIRMMQHLRASFMCSTPSYARRVTQFIQEETDMVPADFRLRGMALGSEPGTATYRDELESIWGCRVFEVSGNSDLIPLFYSECELLHGMHLLSPDLIYLEIVDPIDGQALTVEEGIEGEAVYTMLKREASPLFRFKSNDHIRVVGTGHCKCGRNGIRIRILGRYDDMLIVSGLNVFPSAIEDVLKNHAAHLVASNFRILVPEAGTGGVEGRLKIKVEGRTATGDGPHYTERQVAQRLEAIVKDYLGFTPIVTVVPPGTLPPSEYKTRYLEVVGDE